MPEIDLDDLSTPEHGYTVEDDDDPTDTDIAPWIVVKVTTRSEPVSTPSVTCSPKPITTTRTPRWSVSRTR
jgi:hypothetical protein